MSNLNEQTIIITATVAPLKNGKRAVIVSAAPEGELPVILSGNFAELKTLFDDAWLALLKRQPVIVPEKVRKGEAEKPAPKDTAPEPEPDDDETETGETETVEPEPAPVGEPAPETVEPMPDQLVRIENDPTEAQPTLF